MNKDILLEKIEENYTKHKTKILYISLIIIIFTILQIFLLYCIKLNENEIKNIYKDIFGTIGIIFLAYSFLFNLQNTEKFLIKNITLVSLLSIIIILYFQKDLGIKENDKILLMIGAIFAFWYGYKKYERDKEIEIMNFFGKKYENIKLLKEKDLDNFVKKLFNLWKEEFYLKEKLYISIDLWEIREKYIIRDLRKIYTSIVRKDLDMGIIIEEILNNNYHNENINFYNFLKEKSYKIKNENKEIIKFIYNKNENLKEKINFIVSESYNDLKKDKNKGFILENFIEEINKINITKKISNHLKNLEEEELLHTFEIKFQEIVIIDFHFTPNKKKLGHLKK